MPERPSHEPPAARRRAPSDPPRTADEVEQRQSLDGTPEESGTPEPTEGGPVTADVHEQRQRPDGAVDPATSSDAGDEFLTADMIEQRRVVEDEDSEEYPSE